MINITKYVLLYLLSSKKRVRIEHVSAFPTQVLPTRANLVANSSPYELRREIELSISQINYKARRRNCSNACITLSSDGVIQLHDTECCRKLIGDSLKKYEKLINESETSLIGLYLHLVKPHVQNFIARERIAS